jgi:hypothetical protein
MSSPRNPTPIPPPNPPTPQEYDLPQSVFMCSLGSNALFGQTGAQQWLLDSICTFLVGQSPPGGTVERPSTQGLFFNTLNLGEQNYSWLKGGDWTAVWGPQIYGLDTTDQGASNTMFVAHSPSNNIYVVAIAGTNPTGVFGILDDIQVGPGNMVDFLNPVVMPVSPQTTPPTTALTWNTVSGFDPNQTVAIDVGTSQGLSALYNMVDPWTRVQLIDYLNSINQDGQTLVFTGHSLGGALAPSLAMLLYPQAAATTASTVNPNPPAKGWSNVYIIATAGPTPGTPGFAQQYLGGVPPTNVASPFPYAPTPQVSPTITLPSGYNGPYAPVAIPGVTAPGSLNNVGPMAMPYWNVNYANVYDIVPRAWTLLAGVVEPSADIPQPLTDNSSLASFFANGANLQYGKGGVLNADDAGEAAYGAATKAQKMVDYGGQYAANANQTGYYAQCLPQYIINGTWGYWSSSGNYPATYNFLTTPGLVYSFGQPGEGSIPDSTTLVPWVLNAHLDQYAYALLGFPGLPLPDMPQRNAGRS